jgi:transcriptional regulator with XRE-family HTH domain
MPKFGMRRTMTPNQIVAYNVAKARELRGWTQDQAAHNLAPYLGAKLSGASFSSLERSAWNVNRIKQFSADDLLALSRAFDLPIGFFFIPPPPAFDAGLATPDARTLKGLDPIVLIDAILGRPDNLSPWEQALLAYAASTAPAPKTKRGTTNASPSDLAQRLAPLGATRAKALLRQAFGELGDASEVLERLAEALKLLDETSPADPMHRTARGDTPSPATVPTARAQARRRSTRSVR